ncbi:UDP-2,3-diacylglucosamine diphosphatase [bacterium]|nr:UDP-2,3-diacylglucosamine diphosphatase [bacterium]
MKRIIISDTHIGTKFYKSEELLAFLHQIECDELILAGDIIDFIKIPVFTERCLQILKKMGEAKRVVYVVGNHDEGLVGVVGKQVMGIEFMKRYDFEENGRKFRVEHGDQYDKGALANRVFVKFLSVIQNILEFSFNFDFTTWWTEIQIKKHKLRSIINILRHHPKIDVFIMGHLHIPEALIWVDENQVIKTYINSGDWVTHQTYVSVTEGIARLRKFKVPEGHQDMLLDVADDHV